MAQILTTAHFKMVFINQLFFCSSHWFPSMVPNFGVSHVAYDSEYNVLLPWGVRSLNVCAIF